MGEPNTYEQLEAACSILAAENEALRDALGVIANTDTVTIAREPWRIGRIAARALVKCDHEVWSNGVATFHVDPSDDDRCPSLTASSEET